MGNDVHTAEYFNSVGMDARRSGDYSSAIENYTKAISFYLREGYFFNRARAQLMVVDNPRVNAFLALDDLMACLLLSYRKYMKVLSRSDKLIKDRYFEITYHQCRVANTCFNVAWNRFSADEKTLNLLISNSISEFLGNPKQIQLPKDWEFELNSFEAMFKHIRRLMTIKNEFNNYFSSSRLDVRNLFDSKKSKEEMLRFVSLISDFLDGEYV